MSSHANQAATPLSCRRGGALKGAARPPGDKSISHRAFIFGLLCRGVTEISGLLEGDDVMRTGEACKALGARVERIGEGSWRVAGMGVGALLAPRHPLDFGNAGTGARLMMGVVGGHAVTATFDGDASLRKRPMRRILDPLALMGAQTLSQAEGGRCPIVLRGAERTGADRLSHAGRLGADQIGGAAGRAQCAGRDDCDRGGGVARPHREDAAPFRRRGRSRAGRRGRDGGSPSRGAPNCAPIRSSFPPIRPRPPSRSSPR